MNKKLISAAVASALAVPAVVNAEEHMTVQTYGRINNAIGDPQSVEDAAFHFAKLLQHLVALIGQGKSEHFHFGELVHAIQAARFTSGSAGFRAVTVADPA